MGLEYIFKNFLINRCKGRKILEGSYIFRKFHTTSPLESQLDPPINTVFAPSLINRLTHAPTHPHQNKRHSGLRMKMIPNQDVRRDAKKCVSGYAMATPLAYARVYPEPSARPYTHFYLPYPVGFCFF